MEQLTEQINEGAARALCDEALADHANDPRSSAASQPSGWPAARPAGQPASRPAAFLPPHIVLLWPPESRTGPEKLNSFEKSCLAVFQRNPEIEFRGRLYQNPKETAYYYHYARALYAADGCLRCHAPPAAAATSPTTSRAASATPATLTAPAASRPSTQPNRSQIVGLVSIDMRSRIAANQWLLNRVFLLAAGALTGTLAVIVFTLITNRLILQPVHVLQDTAEKVSSGDLDIRSHIPSGDEFEQLSRTFNVMLANLKATQDQLRAVNKSLDLKLGQLAESNVALYESNRLKSEFLANVSHELRTPLNSILGFAELLKEAAGDPDSRHQRYLQNILSSGKNLLDLINDLLDLAKIEAGRMEVRSEPLSLNDLFEGLVGIIKPLTEKQELTVQPSVAAGVPILETDGPKLQQVLYNFLSNAIKFSPQGGRIELRAEMADTQNVRISVTDQGPGIESEKQGLIFEKFRQLDGSVTRQHSGSGLGLAISKELVNLLGGVIGVTSTPGQGAAFWIVLPLKTPAGEQDIKKTIMQ